MKSDFNFAKIGAQKKIKNEDKSMPVIGESYTNTPTEIINLIFSFVQANKDLLSLRMACKLFNEIITKEQICHNEFPALKDSNQIDAYLAKLQQTNLYQLSLLQMKLMLFDLDQMKRNILESKIKVIEKQKTDLKGQADYDEYLYIRLNERLDELDAKIAKIEVEEQPRIKMINTLIAKIESAIKQLPGKNLLTKFALLPAVEKKAEKSEETLSNQQEHHRKFF